MERSAPNSSTKPSNGDRSKLQLTCYTLKASSDVSVEDEINSYLDDLTRTYNTPLSAFSSLESDDDLSTQMSRLTASSSTAPKSSVINTANLEKEKNKGELERAGPDFSLNMDDMVILHARDEGGDMALIRHKSNSTSRLPQLTSESYPWCSMSYVKALEECDLERGCSTRFESSLGERVVEQYSIEAFSSINFQTESSSACSFEAFNTKQNIHLPT